MSQNYEWFAILISVLLSFPSERELQAWLRKQKHASDFVPYENLLGAKLMKLLQRENKPLPLVLQVQLFLERIVEDLISKKFKNGDVILKNRGFTAALKLDVARAKNLVDELIYTDIALVNTLRNRYAHNLSFGIHEFDMARFSYCEDLAVVYAQYPSTKSREMVNIFIFKWVVQYLLARLTIRYPFLGELSLAK